MQTLGAADVARLLPMADAIDVVARAFHAISSGDGMYPARVHVPLARGDALVMPGYDGAEHLGVKVVTVHPGNAADGKPGTRAIYILVDAEDGGPLLVCDGTALTGLRTGAASGLATRRLALPGASVLAILGTGAQALWQVEAAFAVRPISRVLVVGRSAERAESFVASLRARFPGATIERAGAREAVSAANVVVAATNSTSPVLASDWVGPGTHVNGIGSFRADMCELDPALLGRATVIVDQRDAARKSGELDAALRMGLIDGATITEIGQVGEHARKSTDEITVFKSVGHAALDLFTATEVLRRATLERA